MRVCLNAIVAPVGNAGLFGAVWPIMCPIDIVFHALVSTRSGISHHTNQEDIWQGYVNLSERILSYGVV